LQTDYNRHVVHEGGVDGSGDRVQVAELLTRPERRSLDALEPRPFGFSVQ
jgi:hypothetical protein